VTSGALKSPTEARKCQQDPCRTVSCASTGLKALLRRPRWNIYRAQGASPTATLLSVQGSGHFPASHVSSRLHPHCTAGHLLASIKGMSRAPGGGGTKGEGDERATYEHTDARRRRTEADRVGETWYRQPQTARLKAEPSPSLSLSLSLSLSRNACNPYCKRPLVQDNISLIPSLVFHLASTHLDRGTRH
jgi:hypothetical protein